MSTPQHHATAFSSTQRAAITALKLADEDSCVQTLLAGLRMGADERAQITAQALAMVAHVRATKHEAGTLDAFLNEFDLSSDEGVALLCLAESLLRIPDPATADRLIAERITGADWSAHLGQVDSVFVNAAVWGLMLSGRLLGPDVGRSDPAAWLAAFAARCGEPLVRQAMRTAMRIVGNQFVIAPDITLGLARAEQQAMSFDLLGEGARNDLQVEAYIKSCTQAIHVLGEAGQASGQLGLSLKLSALEARYEEAQRERVMTRLYPRLRQLALLAARAGIPVTLDAEESQRLELSLDLFERLAGDAELASWQGLGIALQAYQKRAPAVVTWLTEVARRRRAGLQVRLVKGAYWDSEIKQAQTEGLSGYPVYTRKAATDVSYLYCAELLLAAGVGLYPQFATHNAATIAAILSLAGSREDYEFQRLYGMGQAIYSAAERVAGRALRVRVYAPVGDHRHLLPYLMRRLLENGANTSFLNHVFDEAFAPQRLVADPVSSLIAVPAKNSRAIPLPRAIFLPQRAAAPGVDLADRAELARLFEAATARDCTLAGPLVNGDSLTAGKPRAVRAPANHQRLLGQVADARATDIEAAANAAALAQPAWDALGGRARATILRCAAAKLADARATFIYWLVHEAGKTYRDAVDEWREAIDFCYYYAAEAERLCADALPLPGVTGEANSLRLRGRGVFVCISPWNFPLAIFIGQVSAALGAGNCVLAKPAEQTPLVALAAGALLHAAGVPVAALQVLTGDGAVGAALLDLPQLDGVAFTGSGAVAAQINRRLAARAGPIVPLIAETGGVNAMIVDSTALLEAVVDDVIRSGFGGAGQRCSALRVLLVQEDIAAPLQEMLQGAMDELVVGDPLVLATDIGPVIDDDALARLVQHQARLNREGRILKQVALGAATSNGTFFGPLLAAIDDWSTVREEVFGPIVHFKCFPAAALFDEIAALRALGYGLTLGIHSRLEQRAQAIARAAAVGNVYVNRHITGAVVGAQPFGGSRLSGTGPKAGGPYYLARFAVEETMTVNTAATRGNVELFLRAE